MAFENNSYLEYTISKHGRPPHMTITDIKSKTE